MPRNDGIDRTFARNRDLSASDVAKAQAHNEREKENYSNPDIVPEQTFRNFHYKSPTGSYQEMFDQMEADGIISTRGLKKDATHFCELLFDDRCRPQNHCGRHCFVIISCNHPGNMINLNRNIIEKSAELHGG